MAHVLAIVQARSQSSRLPGKVLCEINGKPSIYWVMKRVERAKCLDKVVLATSSKTADDTLSDVARFNGWSLSRGSEEDVMLRFYDVIERESPEVIVRVCADNFAICPSVIDQAVEKCAESGLDICNPFLNHSYPFGVGAEVATVDAFRRIFSATRDVAPRYREHIFSWAYEAPEAYKIETLEAPEPLSRPDVNVSVDTCPDLKRLSKIYDEYRSSELDFEVKEIIATWDRHSGQSDW